MVVAAAVPMPPWLIVTEVASTWSAPPCEISTRSALSVSGGVIASDVFTRAGVTLGVVGSVVIGSPPAAGVLRMFPAANRQPTATSHRARPSAILRAVDLMWSQSADEGFHATSSIRDGHDHRHRWARARLVGRGWPWRARGRRGTVAEPVFVAPGGCVAEPLPDAEPVADTEPRHRPRSRPPRPRRGRHRNRSAGRP